MGAAGRPEAGSTTRAPLHRTGSGTRRHRLEQPDRDGLGTRTPQQQVQERHADRDAIGDLRLDLAHALADPEMVEFRRELDARISAGPWDSLAMAKWTVGFVDAAGKVVHETAAPAISE